MKRLLSILCAISLVLTTSSFSGLTITSFAAEIEQSIASPSDVIFEAPSEEGSGEITPAPDVASEETAEAEETAEVATETEPASASEAEIATATDSNAEDIIEEEKEGLLDKLLELPLMLLSAGESPTLDKSHDWYKTTVSESLITSIIITDDAPDTYDESWNADNEDSGDITCYLSGTDLFIVGNGSGAIKANANSARAFADFQLITTIDGFEMLDTSGAVDMEAFFQMDRAIDDDAMYELVSCLDMSSCTDIGYMFCQCDSLVNVTFPDSFDTSKVTSFKSLFSSNDLMETVDLSNLDTSEVTNISSMFSGCENLTSVDLSGFDSSKVTRAGYAFSNCYALTELDLSSFDTRLVTDHDGFFLGVRKLSAFTCGENFTLHSELENPSTTYFYDADGYWYSASTGNAYNKSSVWPLTADTYYPTNPNVSGPILKDNGTWYTSSYAKGSITQVHFVTEYTDSYDETWEAGIDSVNEITCYRSGTVVYVSSNGEEKIRFPRKSNKLFYQFSKLTTVDGFDMIDSGMVTDFSQVFYSCSKLTTVSAQGFVSSMDFKNCTTLSEVFRGCSVIDILNFSEENDFTNLTTLYGAFYSCSKLRKVSMKGCEFPALTNISYMFYSNSVMREIDLSMFDNGIITNISYLASTCGNLRKMNLTGFDTTSVTSSNRFIYNANLLEEISLDGAFRLASLIPNPSSSYIATADGYWHSTSTGATYNKPSTWPTTEDTYVAYTSKSYPQIKNQVNWYTLMGNTRESITAIHFVDSFDDEYTTFWNIDTGSKGEVTAILDGDELYIVGNGAGKIKAAVNSRSWFYKFSSLTTMTGLEMVDFTATTDLSQAFRTCYAIEDDLAEYILANIGSNLVTDFSSFFSECRGLTDITVPSTFDTSHATNLGSFFSYCDELVALDITNLSSKTYESISGFVSSDEKLTSINLEVFDGCENLTSIGTMLSGCESLEYIDLTGIDTTNVASYANCFANCKSLRRMKLDDSFKLYSALPRQINANVAGANGWWFSETTGEAFSRNTTWPDVTDTYTCISPDALTEPTLLPGTTWFTQSSRNTVKSIAISSRDVSVVTDNYFNANRSDSKEILTFVSSNVLNIYVPLDTELTLAADSSYQFSDFPLITKITGSMDASGAENLEYYFLDDAALTSSGISSLFEELDTGNVTTVAHMFEGCSALTNVLFLDLNDFSSLTDMSYMFYESGVTHILLDNPTLSSVTDISYMLAECVRLGRMYLYCFGDGGLENIEGLCENSSPLGTVYLRGFNTTNITDYNNVFNGCHIIDSLCLGRGFTLHSIIPDPDTNYEDGVDGNWYSVNTGLAYNSSTTWPATPGIYSAFPPEELTPLNMLDSGSAYIPYEVERSEITSLSFDLDYVPVGTEVLSWEADASHFGEIIGYLLSDGKSVVISAPNYEYIYYNQDSYYTFGEFVEITEINGMDVIKSDYLCEAAYMFSCCNSLEEIYDTNLIGSSCTDMTNMFYGCSSLKELDTSSWNTENVFSMDSAFRYCESLTSLNLSSLDFSSLSSAAFMFSSDIALKKVKLPTTAPSMSAVPYMFYECSSLTEVDLSGWECTDHMDTYVYYYDDVDWIDHNVIGAYEGMFSGCENLTSVDIGDLSTGNDENTINMFEGCIRLSEITIPASFAYKSQLPTPSATYISGATGKWYSENGIGYIKSNLPSAGGYFIGYEPPKRITIEARELVGEIYAPFGITYKRFKIYPEGSPTEYKTVIIPFGPDDDYSEGYTCIKEKTVNEYRGTYVIELLGSATKDSKQNNINLGDNNVRTTFKTQGIKRWNKAVSTAYIGTL